MPLSSRGRIFLAVVAFLGLWIALAVWAFSSAEPKASVESPGEAAGGHESHDVAHEEDVKGNQPERVLPFIEAVPTFDTSDPRKLIGFSENVFTARVESKVSEVPLKSTIPGSEGSPQVQFQVTAGQVIKSGGPQPVTEGAWITVDQMGGTDPKTGETYRIETATGGEHYNDTILKSGKEYLFATRYDADRGFHVITAQPHGDVLLTGNPEGEATLELYKRAAEDQVNPLAHISGEAPPDGEVR